jgi:DNA modification methylase
MLMVSSKQHIFWGGNYFQLPPSRCWLVWNKGEGFKGRTYAECELAWTSLDENVREITHNPLARGDYKNKQHPTQKPLQVMLWCLEKIVPAARTIIDPFMGSGSTGVAAIELRREFVGIEREQTYFDAACRRISEAVKSPGLF